MRSHPTPSRLRPIWLLSVVPALLLSVFVAPALADELLDADDPDPRAGDDEQEASDPVADELPSFRDVEGEVLEDAVVTLASHGVFQGCDEDLFCPDNHLTRGQFATMLGGALDLQPEYALQPFDDVEGTTHETMINAVAAEGLVNGCEDGRYCPNDRISRAQVASIIARTFGYESSSGSFFDDLSDTHGASVNGLADRGMVDHCEDGLNRYCGGDDITRGDAALVLGRGMYLVDPLEMEPLEERRAEQERLDEEARVEAEAQHAAEVAAEQERIASDRLATWEALAQCESNGRWDINTGNGYYGGLQFAVSSWRAVGGSGYPHNASKQEQIYRAERLLERQGWGAWPACSSKLGLY